MWGNNPSRSTMFIGRNYSLLVIITNRRRETSVRIFEGSLILNSSICMKCSPVRYSNWFNSMFEFCPKLIQFNTQFKIASWIFNSKYYSIWKILLWFNSIDYSIYNNSFLCNSIDYSIWNENNNFYKRYEISLILA